MLFDAPTHLHTESPAAFDELGNILLTVAVAPRFLEKLSAKQKKKYKNKSAPNPWLKYNQAPNRSHGDIFLLKNNPNSDALRALAAF